MGTTEGAAKIDRTILEEYHEINDDEAALVQLLADVRHFCDVNELDLGELDRAAYQHYLTEKGAD